jgi:hypothetical protein
MVTAYKMLFKAFAAERPRSSERLHNPCQKNLKEVEHFEHPDVHEENSDNCNRVLRVSSQASMLEHPE